MGGSLQIDGAANVDPAFDAAIMLGHEHGVVRASAGGGQARGGLRGRRLIAELADEAGHRLRVFYPRRTNLRRPAPTAE